MKRCLPLALFAAAGIALAVCASKPSGQADESRPTNQPAKAAVARARKQVKMLDHIYKQTVVLITDKYVNKETDFAAGSAAVLLFKNISKAGYHNVRLIDATGKPYEAANVAKDAFEKEGVKQLKAGQPYYEQIQTIKGKPYLRAVTPVPVVMKKCIMCHEHYGKVKKGEAIGAISYSIPIE